VQQQAAYISQKPAQVVPELVPSPRADQSLNNESRNEGLVAAVATAWPVLPKTNGASAPGATGADATQAAKAHAVQVVYPNEINDLDRAADDTLTSNSSWSTYLLLISGAVLVAASGAWFFSRMTFMFARRAAGPRMDIRLRSAAGRLIRALMASVGWQSQAETSPRAPQRSKPEQSLAART
jgi:hypothetical protein